MFEGFSPETVDFLWGIRMNNERQWFQAHKAQYVQTLYEPMKALGAELFRPFADRPGDLLKVSRIYRDARLHHPLPYKESLWICIRRDVSQWSEHPCLFFQIDPDGMDYGFSVWKPRPMAMKHFRRVISAQSAPFLALIEQTQAQLHHPITAQEYRHPEVCSDPALARFFLWKSDISCIFHEDFGPDAFSPALAQRVCDTFEKLLPLYDYFNSITTAD